MAAEYVEVLGGRRAVNHLHVALFVDVVLGLGRSNGVSAVT